MLTNFHVTPASYAGRTGVMSAHFLKHALHIAVAACQVQRVFRACG